MKRVSDIMIKNPVCCTPLTNIEESKVIMKKYHCSKLPVVNTLKDLHIIGVVSDKDMDGLEGGITQCMSKNLKAISEDESVNECLRVMIMNNIEQIPVIDKQGHFCGIVTQDEIINWPN